MQIDNQACDAPMPAAVRPSSDILQRNNIIADRLENLSVDISNRLQEIPTPAPPEQSDPEKRQGVDYPPLMSEMWGQQSRIFAVLDALEGQISRVHF